jgi:hypothetical protein
MDGVRRSVALLSVRVRDTPRRPRISDHSEASCTPYGVGNHALVRPACGKVMRPTSPSAHSLASLRLVCSVRTEAAIIRCICSVAAIRYRVITPSASRSALPASSADHHGSARSPLGATGCPAPRVPVTAAAAWTRAPTAKARPRSQATTPVGQIVIPSDNRPHSPANPPFAPTRSSNPAAPWSLHPATDRHRRGRTLLVGLYLRNQALGERTGRVVAPSLGRRSSHPHCSRWPALGSSVVHICLRM